MASIQHDSKDILELGHYSIFRDKRLGSGTFGMVYAGFDNLKCRHIAVKHIMNSSEEFSSQEIEVLKRLTEHDNIVRFYDSFVHQGDSWIVMQYCDGETLEKVMEEKCPRMKVRLDFIYQLIEALQYMHNHSPPTAHRDLKPDNVIIIRDTLVKICDFGLAKFINVGKTMNATTFGGTLNYMAPEFFVEHVAYDAFKVDIFATGLIILGTITCTKQQKMNHHFKAGKLAALVIIHHTFSWTWITLFIGIFIVCILFVHALGVFCCICS